MHETLNHGRACPRNSEDGERDANNEEVSHPSTLECSNQEATAKQNRHVMSVTDSLSLGVGEKGSLPTVIHVLAQHCAHVHHERPFAFD